MIPTITAFEKSPDRDRGLARDMRARRALANNVIERHRQRTGGRVKRITIDLDPAHRTRCRCCAHLIDSVLRSRKNQKPALRG